MFVRGVYGRAMRGKCALKDTTQTYLSVGRESKYTWHVPVVRQRVDQRVLIAGLAEMQRLSVP
jgi:hypothetical protein